MWEAVIEYRTGSAKKIHLKQIKEITPLLDILAILILFFYFLKLHNNVKVDTNENKLKIKGSLTIEKSLKSNSM